MSSFRAVAPLGLEPSGFFVLRVPLLPFEVWQRSTAGRNAAFTLHDDDAALSAAIEKDRVPWREHLAAFAARPEVREALLIASPDLDQAIDKWLDTASIRRDPKVERSVAKYLARASTRPTPFGLFASWTTGRVGAATRLLVAERDATRKHSRLDAAYLYEWIDHLSRDPLVRSRVSDTPSNTLYHVGQKRRYIERRHENGKWTFHLAAVELDAALERVLDRASNGATVDELAVAAKGDDVGVSTKEAVAYVVSLIESQILVSAIEPAITAGDVGRRLAKALKKCDRSISERPFLQPALAALEAIDRAPLGTAIDRLRALPDKLPATGATEKRGPLVQVDLQRWQPDAMIGPEVIDLARRGTEILHAMMPRPRETSFGSFVRRFVQRYEHHPVPLLEALDDDVGIGYEPAEAAESIPPTARWTAREQYLLSKLTRPAATSEWILTEGDLRALNTDNRLPLPDGLSVFATVLGRRNDGASPSDVRLFFRGASGPSGAQMLGRFCQHDGTLRTLVRRHLRAEESLSPGKVFAEIVHVPDPRSGNVVTRPRLREWELPVGSPSSVGRDRQIRLGDLMLSYEEGRLVLRSRSLGCPVVPRLTSAQNFTGRSLGIYRFLCEFQYAGVTPSLYWDWGVLGTASVLPRVSAGPIVFARASWLLSKVDIGTSTSEARRFRSLQSWREERRVPRLVQVVDGDHELAIDLDHPSSVDLLPQQMNAGGTIRLVEMLTTPDTLVASGADGFYANELIIPFVRKSVSRRDDRAARSRLASVLEPPNPSSRRIWIPGSDWLFIKLYAGASSLDHILTGILSPVVERLSKRAVLDRWFFLRYADPELHVRLRLHGDPTRLNRVALPQLLAAAESAVKDGLVWKVQLDTYEPEIERFGGEKGLHLAEHVFAADSEAVVRMLEQSDGQRSSALSRWLLAFRSVDQLLEDFGFDLTTRQRVIERSRDSFAPAGGLTAASRRVAAQRLRTDRGDIERLLDRTADATSPHSQSLRALDSRSRRIVRTLRHRRRLHGGEQWPLAVEGVAETLVHLHLNRLLGESRSNEALLYDLLARVYASQRARSASGPKPAGD